MAVRVQYTKVNGRRAEARVSDEAAQALRERPDLQGPAARRDFILQHLHAGKNERSAIRPVIDSDARSGPAAPGDQWNCGNRHLNAQAALALIAENRIAAPEAMTWLEGATDEAGPDFCRELIDELQAKRIPF